MTVYPPVSVFLGDCGECQLELDGGELGSRGPALAVQDVLLEQRVEDSMAALSPADETR
jgi:hypothetical protein